jgi:cell division transport system permease protein
MSRAAATVTPRERSSLGTGGIGAWLRAHRAAIATTLQQFARQPVTHLLTIIVLATALAMPLGMYVLLQNLDRLLQGWGAQDTEMSVFLRDNVDDATAARLANGLANQPGVAGTRLIDRQAALEEYRTASGFGEAIAALGSNPLPAVIVVRPADGSAVATLVAQLEALPEVDSVKADLEWVQRLQGMSTLARRLVSVIGAALALAVLFIAGNAIRSAVAQRREEIEVYKLVGATDAYIRRPFLYTGLFYGVLGALLASIVIAGIVLAVARPVRELAALYQSQYALDALSLRDVMLVALAAGALGLIGAWWSAAHHVRQIEVR